MSSTHVNYAFNKKRHILQALGKRDILTKLIEGEPSNINQESLGDNFHPLAGKAAPLRPTPEEHSRVTPCQHPSHRSVLA